MNRSPNIITPTPWGNVKIHTPARIALGHAGGSIPTRELLRFQADHASARDAVHSEVDFDRIAEEIHEAVGEKCIFVHSAVTSRQEYLRRPDLGRKLDTRSKERLLEWKKGEAGIAFVVGDGLSATAINHHAVSLLNEIFSYVEITRRRYSIILAQETRVALGDEIGEIMGSSMVIMLIGERPGLSNTESIGAYVTYNPKVGRTDAERNCISNICPQGLPIQEAAREIVQLVKCALQYEVTGVALGGRLSMQLGLQSDLTSVD
jgi:ethanolamine ammonia-lyase small subunit